ncbi:MAG: sulfite exporter TauE/SafE family protein, partial [Pelagibacteraceae bacterium]
MKLKNEEIRATMSILVLIFGLKFGYDLFFGKVINQISKLGNSLNANNSIAEFVVNTAQNFPGTYAISTMLVCVIFAAISAYAFKKFI